MNRTRISWCQYTWNPLTGCLHGCSYCYARTFPERFPEKYPNGFEPTFWEERLEEPLRRKKPSTIFVCSMGELVAPWVPDEQVEAITQVMEKAYWHTFLVLTKAPEGYRKYQFPENVWLGGTATNQKMADRACDVLKDVGNKTFLSCEPLLDSLLPKEKVDWLIIGACSYPEPSQPKWSWVEDLLIWADLHRVPVHMKDNLETGGFERREEYPDGEGWGRDPVGAGKPVPLPVLTE